ncbi:MAG: hypothetical protein QUT30_16150 [Acidobacteriota bacterium]|nr:hypothetical protein [Acidobacteriota bacterium]
MPKPRQQSSFDLDPDLAEVLITGRDLLGLFADDQLRAAWQAHKTEVMRLAADRLGPGRRPWAWWRYDHPDLFRRQIGGTGMAASEVPDAPGWMLENCFGKPRGVFADTCDRPPEPIYESEADCLARAGLLTAAERRTAGSRGK